MFFLSLLLSGFILAEEIVVDVSSSQVCDAIYNPPNCRGGSNTNHKTNLRSNVGIDLGTTPSSMPEYSPRISIIDRRRGQPERRRVIGTPRPEDLVTDGSEVSPVSTNPENRPEQQSAAPGNDEEPFSQATEEQAGGSGNFSAASSPSPGSIDSGTGSSGSESRVVNGFLYTPEESPQGVKASEVEKNPALPTALSQQTPTAVDLNKENDSSSDSPKGGAFANSPGTQPFGQFQSGGGTPVAPAGSSPNSDNSFVDRLKNLASKLLGGKYFGLNAQSKSASRKSNAGRNTGAGARGGRASKNANGNPDVRGILQDRLNRYRGLASQLEFASSKTNLFGHLCKHYKVYAKRNKISNVRHSCPK